MQITPLGVIHTPYKQKFAIPRQPSLVKQAVGDIHFNKEFHDINLLRGIEQYTHLWLIFAFHETADKGWSPLVRPPRLGGNEKMGVLATRSTFRPNPLGLSVVEYVDWQNKNGQLILRVRGIDLLDQTPIFDIKPYIPYADSIPNASAGFAQQPPLPISVLFSELAKKQIAARQKQHPDLQDFIEEVLKQDPRPAYKKQQQDDKTYRVQLYDIDVVWRAKEKAIEVIELVSIPSSN